ncbi:FCD domain-containing protein [Epidermidibacterium keratini]|uniref:FCD domain-containing protein n=1 Tax=Epidermidibacterium keratini TaxID=1891644 RepID=A0A7L4YWB6_9ACTN|nr:GntR family transcriptional regulator [Epidermidibacterium keratini]QHC02347.1 FCD domain-containing protein [Epidermidibacterium keratini]
MPPTRPRASTEDVHALLRADVLAGVHEPGSKLKFAALCQRYGASVSVVREVLSRLAEQGLVTSEPRVGFRVRSVSIADLRELTSARIDVESLALRAAIERGEMDWESDLVAAHHRLERTPLLTGEPPRVSDEWERAHATFHSTLLAACGNAWLLAFACTLRDAAEFYRRWSQTQEPGRNVAAEHRGLLQAALDREPDSAVQRLREHYQRTADILEAALAATAPTETVPR